MAIRLYDPAPLRRRRLSGRAFSVAAGLALPISPPAVFANITAQTQAPYSTQQAALPEALTEGSDSAISAQLQNLIRQADASVAKADYAEAENLWQQILAIAEKEYGQEHPSTATSLGHLAGLYQDQGRYGEAESLYKRSLSIREKVLGPEHPLTAISLNNLAGLHYHQGRYSEAELLYRRALAIDEKVFGLENPSTAVSLNNLAGLYYTQGRLGEAELLYKRALAIIEKELGPQDPSTATSLRNLAVVFTSQNRYGEADALLKRSLSIREKVLGPEHPDTADSLESLAWVHEQEGRYGHAESLYKRSLAIRENIPGPAHPDTATSLNHLAELYNIQGRYEEAEPLFKRSLSIREKVLGLEHPSTATSLDTLAYLYEALGAYGEAEPLYKRSLSIREKVLGPEHPSTAISLGNLASLFMRQGDNEEAEKLYKRALAIHEKVLGPNHPSTGISLVNIALLYEADGRYGEAEQLLRRALAINEEVLSPAHPYTAITLSSLASIYDFQGRYEEAETLYKRSLAINEKIHGAEHRDTAANLNDLASLYVSQGRHKEAEALYKRALAINEKVLGPGHPSTATMLNNLGSHYDLQGLYGDARPLQKRGLFIEIVLVQREAPFLARSKRQAYLDTLGSAYKAAFSNALKDPIGKRLALFARINRQGLLEEIEKRQAQLASLPGNQQAIAEELRSLTKQLASLSITPEQRQTLKSRQEELERELYRLLPELKPRIVEVDQVAAALPPGSALVEFQRYQPYDGRNPRDQRWGDARYIAFVLKGDASITAVDLGPAALIESRIKQALRGSEEQLDDAESLWAVVGDLILDPLVVAIRGAQTLFISPDAELNRIPFAALPAPESQQLLSDALQVRMLTTGRELIDLAQPGSPAKGAPLVVANPDFDHSPDTAAQAHGPLGSSKFQETGEQRSADLATLHWPPLPATAKEGQTIAELTKARLLTQQQATASAIQQQRSPKLLHIASHAFFLADQSQSRADRTVLMRSGLEMGGGLPTAALQGESPLLRSGIALAGANLPAQGPAARDDDGYLTALEVAQLDWAGTELVVISACESGKGDLQAGEGVYGLKRAIAVAGARTSLLSLWKVDDAATSAFMQAFYGRLKTGQGRADALAATQKQFRQHPIPAWRHPYVWAAFQLSGDWRPMRW